MAAPETIADIKVIDVDTHVVEPYDLWTSRVSTKKWGDRVPHVVWSEKRQEDIWLSGDRILGAAAAPAQAGYQFPPPTYPPRLSDADPRTWRVQDRLRAMDEYGVHTQVLYPNVAGFGGGRFSDPKDAELNLLLIRAYNDWLTDYASAAPDRLIPVMGIPFWDIDLCIAEMARCRAAGHRGIIMSQEPEHYGQPKISDPHWDPMWASAQEMGLPISFHIGGGDMSGWKMLAPSAGKVANYAAVSVTFNIAQSRCIASLIAGGVCHRFPDLNFISVESGVSWIPYLMHGMDWMWVESDVRSEHPEYDLLPSEYFKRQIYACFWFEHGPMLDATIQTLGPDNLLYETDFPHPTSMSPGPASSAVAAKDFIRERLGHLDDTVLRKLLQENAARVHGLG
ncbi:amidohydrolase family protein [Streptomyces sp. NPDC057690]|uniref:amidohydrolase family protein n=1 Tax=Streptomyces sp. NPDC057690 TaxID=3346214 RepID=UPI00369D6CE8